MVQMPVDKVIYMIAVRNGLMPATRPMNMAWLMTAATMVRRATIGIAVADFDHVLINMVAMGMMKVAIMQIINVIAMAHRDVATSGTMNVIMVRMVR